MSAFACYGVGMEDLPSIARHWARQSEKGKGIRLSERQLDVLNAIGVGDLIAKATAEHQRELAEVRVRPMPIELGRARCLD